MIEAKKILLVSDTYVWSVIFDNNILTTQVLLAYTTSPAQLTEVSS